MAEWFSLSRRRPMMRQGVFGFVVKAERLDRTFKLVIAARNNRLDRLLSDGAVARPVPGRLVDLQGTRLARQAIGLPPDRGEIDADWKHKRLFDIEQSRATLASTFAEYPPATCNGSCSMRAWIPTMPWCVGVILIGPYSFHQRSSNPTIPAARTGSGQTCGQSGSATSP